MIGEIIRKADSPAGKESCMSLRRISKTFFPFAAALLLAPLTWAKTEARKTIIETLKFSHPTIVHGTIVQPGEYQLVVRGNELRVEESNHRVLAQSPVRWKQLGHMADRTMLDIDRGVLTKITLGGRDDAVLLVHSLAS
jgi:hypothetical protein